MRVVVGDRRRRSDARGESRFRTALFAVSVSAGANAARSRAVGGDAGQRRRRPRRTAAPDAMAVGAVLAMSWRLGCLEGDVVVEVRTAELVHEP